MREHQGPDIWCEDLVRIYSTEGVEVQALQGLNLVVDPGDVVALVGASGSGKSTLLGILSGLDRPTGGRARVAGVDLLSMSRAQRVDYQRHTVGFVWQQTSRNLLPFLSAAENVALPMVISGRRERGRRVEELLGLLGLGDCADRRPTELSGGQQQRVAIATALANSPAVLLADEPTGELDDTASAQVLEVMREAAGSLGTTVLVVTHDPTVSDHVRRTVAIRDGRTSTEVLRYVVTDESGEQRQVAREYTVIDRAGRIQLPKAHVEGLGLRDRVRLEHESTHVQVWPDDEEHQTRGGDGPAPPSGRAPDPRTGRSVRTQEDDDE
ncbi:ABC transporter ATP-binding protein [uncultured Serinicoccus sp.]|uniref:ABC transporter ATP-binding protein n=1 Tax=uncultured Serinicoccus sp. TaxID=735514 RepID=UPI0026151526|nr:ABC transporter ATP-binding protein [uncultured Serinicoccus sp.]